MITSSNNILNTNVDKTQISSIYVGDNELDYDWEDTLCISLESGRFIFITFDIGKELEIKKFDPIFGPKLDKDRRFFKMRVGMKPGTSWIKILDYDVSDYIKILNNESVVFCLNNQIVPNPTFISEIKTELRNLQIDNVISHNI